MELEYIICCIYYFCSLFLMPKANFSVHFSFICSSIFLDRLVIQRYLLLTSACSHFFFFFALGIFSLFLKMIYLSGISPLLG